MPNTLILPDGFPLIWDQSWSPENKQLFLELREANRRSLIEEELLKNYPYHNRQLGIPEYFNNGARIRQNHFIFKRDSILAELLAKNINNKEYSWLRLNIHLFFSLD